MATATINIGAGSTATDLFATLAPSPGGLASTPAHELLIQNDGNGVIRFGDPSDVQTGEGPKLGPGQRVQLRVPAGNRIGAVGDAGNAASDISLLLQIGG